LIGTDLQSFKIYS